MLHGIYFERGSSYDERGSGCGSGKRVVGVVGSVGSGSAETSGSVAVPGQASRLLNLPGHVFRTSVP